jgi:hypothetical protein
MPLSRLGIRDVVQATTELGLPLDVVAASSIYSYPTRSDTSLVATMIRAGATTHYPAVIVHRRGRLIGNAILGYKRAGAYRAMIEERLTSPAATVDSSGLRDRARTRDRLDVPARAARAGAGTWLKDLRVSGQSGPYFRHVPGTSLVAFAANDSVLLLDITNGTVMPAPGHVDFVPTPDGRFFVTPGRDRAGLLFFDAAEVTAAARTGRGAAVQPFFSDPQMRDQYPSIGIIRRMLDGMSGATTYRVVTSWFDGVLFRDYDIVARANGSPVITPAHGPSRACPGRRLSLPIVSQDGTMLAARDERSATTKIFRLHDDGQCDVMVDIGVQTGKVAFSPDHRRVAFAIPQGAVRVPTGTLWVGDDDSPEWSGIFVLTLDDLRITRVRGSETVNRLAFPEFVGADSIMFLVSGLIDDAPSAFRLVCCIP